MTTTTETPTTVDALTALVEQGLASVLPEEAVTPADGPQTCGSCEGTGMTHPSWSEVPRKCTTCWDGNGSIEAPELRAILGGLYTDHGGNLRRRKSYLSPGKVQESSNAVTAEVYAFVRANLEFDLGRNVNLGGIIMNDLRKHNPWKPWADAVNAVLLALHGKSRSEGAMRWAQALGMR